MSRQNREIFINFERVFARLEEGFTKPKTRNYEYNSNRGADSRI